MNVNKRHEKNIAFMVRVNQAVHLWAGDFDQVVAGMARSYNIFFWLWRVWLMMVVRLNRAVKNDGLSPILRKRMDAQCLSNQREMPHAFVGWVQPISFFSALS